MIDAFNSISIIDSITTASVVMNFIYPAGSIYMSVNSTNPAYLFGGTWTAWGSCRMLVGIDTSDSSLSTVEKTGGEKAHTLSTSEIPAHTHGKRTLIGSVWNMAAQNATQNISCSGVFSTRTTSEGVGYATVYNTRNDGFTFDRSYEHTSVGGSGSHNNLQPYITCYIWKRTA